MTRPSDFRGWSGRTRTVEVPGPVRIHVVLTRDPAGVLREVFVHGVREGRAEINGVCRLVSQALQRGDAPAELARSLRGQASEHAPVRWPGAPEDGGGMCLSVADAIGRLIEGEPAPPVAVVVPTVPRDQALRAIRLALGDRLGELPDEGLAREALDAAARRDP